MAYYTLLSLQAPYPGLVAGFWVYMGHTLVSLTFALLISQPKPWMLWGISAYTGLAIVVSLFSLLGGSARAIPQLVIPAIILYCVLRPESRQYLARRTAS